MISRLGLSSRVRKRGGIERWFMLRLTVTGYGLAHVLPGGGAVAATMTYRVLRRRGLDPEKVGLALAAVSVLVYGALGVLLAGSLAFMLTMGGPGTHVQDLELLAPSSHPGRGHLRLCDVPRADANQERREERRRLHRTLSAR
jgi:hypothetical protein